jgi:DNA-binding transcriptional MerR regulator
VRIGELAKATGLTAKTVRFYEAQGLLPKPPRTLSRYRVYQVEDVTRLEFIRKAKRLGLSLAEVRSILGLHHRKEPTCVHVRSLLEGKLAQVDRAIKELRDLQAELVQLRERAGALVDCRPAGGRICEIIEGAPEVKGRVVAWMEARPVRGPGSTGGN